MRNADKLTAIGLITGIAVLLIGMSMGSSLKIFWDLPSVFITVLGSFCCVLITCSEQEVFLIWKITKEAFKEKINSNVELIKVFVKFSQKARKEGLLSIEEEVDNLEDDFLKKGLQMVIDGTEPDVIQEVLELEISEMDSRHQKAINVYSTWGVYAPAFGMIGTLIGLVQMLDNLTDVSNIAAGMAKALITTFYGSVLANLICMPLANNLKQKNAKESSAKYLIIEGVLCVQSGANPRLVEEKLMSYLSPKQKLEYINSINSKTTIED